MRRNLFQNISNAVTALATRNISFEFENIPIRIGRASYRKIINWILVELSIILKSKRAWGWPTFLQIEPTTLCNMRCSFCPVSKKSERPTGNMDIDMFEKFIDQAGGYALLLVLWGWG